MRAGVRVLEVGGDDTAEGFDLERRLLLGVPPLRHVPRRRRRGDFFQMELVGFQNNETMTMTRVEKVFPARPAGFSYLCSLYVGKSFSPAQFLIEFLNLLRFFT
jgi:hypothetical protein